MSKATKWIAAILSVLMLLALGGQLVLGWFNYQKMLASSAALEGLRADNGELRGEVSALREELGGVRDQITELEHANDDQYDPGQEDDVRISHNYVIRSTLPISDAYKSGDRSALDDKQKETLDMASAILEEIITPEMEPYDKEQAVYLWMTSHLAHDEGLLPVIPTTQADCDNPYGVLKYHNAVCVGYATTFRLFMQMLDIPCMVVHNTERYHSWDLVQLDGGWYHTDIYSDVGSGNYAHFNLTDAMQSDNQSWNKDFFPAATKSEYCYAFRASQEAGDLYEIPAALRSALNDRVGMFSLRFGSDFDEKQASIVQMMLNQIQDRIENTELSNEVYMDWTWMSMENGWLLSVNLNWYNQGEDSPEDLPDDVYEKIGEAVEEAFGDLEEQDYWEDDSDWAVG